MADPFTIAVSVGGLASLGIQLLQGLNKYAGSALDSRGRIKAISTDIGLTVQVVQALDTTIQDDANRTMMNDDAEKLAQDAIALCQEIFIKIQSTLPDFDATGIRKRDFVTWPFIEPKLDLLRGNLEKVKTTLQLLMNVIIFAAMSKRHAEQVSLDQQRLQIQKLLEEKAEAEVRLEKLERDHADALATNVLAPLPLENMHMQAMPQEPDPIINLATIEPLPQVTSPTRDLTSSTPGSAGNTARMQCRIAEQQPLSPTVASSREVDASPARPGAACSITSSDSNFDSDSESEDLMITLHDDYTACLRQLKTLQSRLDMALKKMFIPTTGMPTANPEHDAVARGKVVKIIDRSVRETSDCFHQRIFRPGAHQKIMKESDLPWFIRPRPPLPGVRVMLKPFEIVDATPESMPARPLLDKPEDEEQSNQKWVEYPPDNSGVDAVNSRLDMADGVSRSDVDSQSQQLEWLSEDEGQGYSIDGYRSSMTPTTDALRFEMPDAELNEPLEDINIDRCSYATPSPMPDQFYTRPSVSVDPFYGRERPTAPPDSERHWIMSDYLSSVPRPIYVDDKICLITSKKDLPSVEDLVKRWTRLDPDNLDA